MKRLHVHLQVSDLEGSIRHYSSVFGTAPGMVRDDWARWLLDDPAVNFAISRGGNALGVDHLGLQVDSLDEVEAMEARLDAEGSKYLAQRETSCCYHRSDKSWSVDPDGVRWETFVSHGVDESATVAAPVKAKAAACCGGKC